MPTIWNSAQERETAWAIAKKSLTNPDGSLKPDGTKLRRKDPASGISHSFIVVEGKLLAMAGKGRYLGKGKYGKVKLAEDEQGGLYALKVMDVAQAASTQEAKIAHKYGQALKQVVRGEKAYLAYQYLGRPLTLQLKSDTFSYDELYVLLIKTMLVIHAFHEQGYVHNDLHGDNIVVDDHGECHLIDFDAAEETIRSEWSPQDDVSRVLLNLQFLLTEVATSSGRPFFKACANDLKLIGNTPSALVAAQRLALLRCRLEKLPLYKASLPDIEAKQVVSWLNEHGDEIQHTYTALRALIAWVPNPPLEPQSQAQFKEQLQNFINFYKYSLSASASHNELVVKQYVFKLEQTWKEMSPTCATCQAVEPLVDLLQKTYPSINLPMPSPPEVPLSPRHEL